MSIKSDIEKKLVAGFSPERLSVVDESHLHAGHLHHDAGEGEAFDGGGETHFRVRLVSAKFSGMTRLARHRAVNEILAQELEKGVHALAIEAVAPGEPTRF